jgi:hypothetical protein
MEDHAVIAVRRIDRQRGRFAMWTAPATLRAAETLWCLALVTVLQFTEALSDRQAAHAVRR